MYGKHLKHGNVQGKGEGKLIILLFLFNRLLLNAYCVPGF